MKTNYALSWVGTFFNVVMVTIEFLTTYMFKNSIHPTPTQHQMKITRSACCQTQIV